MAIANLTTRSTGAQGASADLDVTIPMDSFDNATLKLDGAQALVEMFGIFASESNDKQLPVAGSLISRAMSGIGLLIKSAVDDLVAVEGGAQ